jgi:N-acetylmuramoyl-L-alanine amidase
MKIYVSPSVQEHNIGYGQYGTEEARMNAVADVLCSILTYNSIQFKRNNSSMALAQIIADSNAYCTSSDVHLAIHSNAGPSSAEGTVGFYYKGSVNGQKLAQCIYNRVAPLSPGKDRGVVADTGYGEIVKTKAMATIIEVGFHTNPADSQYIMNHAKELGIVLAQGLGDYMGIAMKIPPQYAPAPQQPTTPPVEDPKNKQIKDLQAQVANLQSQITTKDKSLSDLQTAKDSAENRALCAEREVQRLNDLLAKDDEIFKNFGSRIAAAK